ncbi:DUF3883 domain-containing protein [Paraburkholderia sediminicola]|uniref:DUF3883 domain-containing protein n=1 Tax=Paraburkholderia sediminicola TaxID=458836 RepID=UPI0038BBF251
MPTTNSPNNAFESNARQSVFLGLLRLQELRRKYPGSSDDELVRAACAGTANAAAADVATAANLIESVNLDGLAEDAVSMRRFLRELLAVEQPPWVVAALRGREALQSAMPHSVGQCFSFAKLFERTPDQEAVAWWDELVESQRLSDQHGRKSRGREGERLTVTYETERLSKFDPNLRPKWVALDDEWLGYDVLSFDVDSDGHVTNRLIEVKSCSALPLRIYLTRNEWEKARQAGNSFAIHVWHLPTGELTELKGTDIAGHVPVDQGHGTWREALIDLKSVQEVDR